MVTVVPTGSEDGEHPEMDGGPDCMVSSGDAVMPFEVASADAGDARWGAPGVPARELS
jgi:hypothetical protein